MVHGKHKPPKARFTDSYPWEIADTDPNPRFQNFTFSLRKVFGPKDP